jgi:spore maturation protein CgeB
MRILYIGSDSGTSGHRANAMRRLGHDVYLLDPLAFAPKFPGFAQWCFRTGSAGVAEIIAGRLAHTIENDSFDAAWVDGGEFVTPGLVRALRRAADRVVNYNHDDPFGSRDGLRFRQYRSAVKDYDLVVVVRECNIAEARRAGARRVLHLFRSADEVAHASRQLSEADHRKWSSEVVFVGTWMPERGAFMKTLVEQGIPLSIFGNGWRRAREWQAIRGAWRDNAADAEEDYVRAVQSARICLGLVSQGNRDLHTTRSLEIPSIGSLFLAERTTEHQALYREGEEAVFWADATECAEQCRALLADEARIRTIASAGHGRAIANGHFNEKAVGQVLGEAMG